MIERCRYCGRLARDPCRSTRDLEDRAIVGERACYGALERAGGGERGMDRVRLLRDEQEERSRRLLDELGRP